MKNSALPNNLYTATQVRELDRLAIEKHAIAGFELMQRAAGAAYRLLKQDWPQARRILVVCGPGNNGGDGYLLASLAARDAMQVTVVQAGDMAGQGADAHSAWQQWRDCTGATMTLGDCRGGLPDADVIVDALLGTGLQRELAGEWFDLVRAINRHPAPVLAIDIPSGLNSDSGAIMAIAVQADVTITFIGMKRGMLTGAGPDVCGRIFFDNLDVPQSIYRELSVDCTVLDQAHSSALLTPRTPASHKGQFGHVLVVGGDVGMGGAARLAGEAAARIGAGLVSVATRPGHVPAVIAARPELMCHGIDDASQLPALLSRATVVAVGPGLGRGDWGQALLSEVLNSQLYLVVDADALNLIAERPYKRGRWIFTPHPGEAARLLACSTAQIQADRYAAVRAISDRYNCITVLKGAGSLVHAVGESRIALCRQGNPGMATAGMGDVLTGVIAGLVAQGLPLLDAARSGVQVHAQAADRVAEQGQRGMLASDLFPALRRLVNPDGQDR